MYFLKNKNEKMRKNTQILINETISAEKQQITGLEKHAGTDFKRINYLQI